MATFRDIAKGKRARRKTMLPHDGTEFPLDVRVLGTDDDLEIAAAALAAAKATGAEPLRGDPIYERHFRAHTLLLGCVDSTSPEGAPVPFFSSVDEILGKDGLTSDQVAWLYEEQERWQDECSPLKRSLSVGECIGVVARLVEGDDRPFLRLSPGAQVSFVRFTANRLWNSLEPSSRSSSTSEEATPKTNVQ